METQYAERIILIGPTGSGKTTVGAAVAERLGWRFVDTDALVEEMAGASIPAIFAAGGEGRFRELETAALRDALEQSRVVVATGAGSVEKVENALLMRAAGYVVALDCRPETALERLRASAAAASVEIGAVRPMLAGDDAEVHIRKLQERRASRYAQCDLSVATEDLYGLHPPHEFTADRVAARIVAALVIGKLLSPDGADERVRHVATSYGDGYDAVVAWGSFSSVNARLDALGLPHRGFFVMDSEVADLYWLSLKQINASSGHNGWMYSVPSGEASKSRERLAAIHDWLAERRAERAEPVIALGGGVVGDLAGFAAATYLRGVPLVQAPTSLLAQVDASIGGKTGINHPAGKNLLGAFYPPRLVLADPAVLLTLPPRQFREGWAEVVKHGVALDAGYFDFVEENAERLLARRPAELTAAVAGSVAIKASVVEGDEREREGGRRHLLNYGHTLGHAIEAVAGYGTWLHGEAVSAGMVFAARLGHRIGVTPSSVVERQEALLARFGLRTRVDGLAVSALLRTMLWDKKVRGGQVRWVLPTALGASRLVADVSEGDVRATLLALGADDDGAARRQDDA